MQRLMGWFFVLPTDDCISHATRVQITATEDKTPSKVNASYRLEPAACLNPFFIFFNLFSIPIKGLNAELSTRINERGPINSGWEAIYLRWAVIDFIKKISEENSNAEKCNALLSSSENFLIKRSFIIGDVRVYHTALRQFVHENQTSGKNI